MLMAVFEWMLWLAAFIYCLVKVYTKADHWSIRALAVVMMVLFSLIRYVTATVAGAPNSLVIANTFTSD